MEDNYDVIVIGGGLGGLTAGAKLAKEGKKVLLIEQHYIVGGCATVFKRKGFTFEVGLHEMDGLHEDDLKTKIFKELGVFENVEFIKVPEFYRFKNERVDIVLPHGTEEAIKELIKHFPLEEKGIRKYFKTIHSIYDEIYKLPEEKWKLLLMFPLLPFICPTLLLNINQNLGKFLDSITKNEELKIVLLGNLAYYSDDPYSMSMAYFSFGQSSYFNGGGYFIRGGSQILSDYLANYIRKNSGEVILNHLVTKIIVKEGKAVGVEFRKHNTEIFRKVFSNNIIANAAIPTLVPLLPEKESKGLLQKIKTKKYSCSLTTIYIGFDRDIREIGSKNYSMFVFDNNVVDQRTLQSNSQNDFESRNFEFIDYSHVDSSLAPEGKSIGIICFVDYLDQWEGLSDQEYKEKKKKVAEIFLERLDKEIPGVMECVEYYEVGTPKTIQRFTMNTKGTPYGFSQSPLQAGIFRISNKSFIHNLYFASAWAYPGHGFTGAILGGWYCANELLRIKNNIAPELQLSPVEREYEIGAVKTIKSKAKV